MRATGARQRTSRAVGRRGSRCSATGSGHRAVVITAGGDDPVGLRCRRGMRAGAGAGRTCGAAAARPGRDLSDHGPDRAASQRVQSTARADRVDLVADHGSHERRSIIDEVWDATLCPRGAYASQRSEDHEIPRSRCGAPEPMTRMVARLIAAGLRRAPDSGGRSRESERTKRTWAVSPSLLLRRR